MSDKHNDAVVRETGAGRTDGLRLIKIYGERNTGTNYLDRLVRLNIDATVLPGVVPRAVMNLQRLVPGSEAIRDWYFRLTFPRNLGWKHSIVDPDSISAKCRYPLSELLIVTLTKNPYSWALSLARRPYNQRKPTASFEQFLVTPWETTGREGSAGAYSSPVEMWNKKNKSYIAAGSRLVVANLKYEDLLRDPAQTIDGLCDSFALARRRSGFENVTESTKDDGKNFTYYRDYYLEKKWKQKLTPEAIETIGRSVDGEVLEFFGYDRL